MNKLRIITALNYSQLENRINEIGETLKILSVSLSEADNGRLKVAAILFEEPISIKEPKTIKTIDVCENHIRIFNEFDGIRLVVTIEGVDYMSGNGGGVFDLGEAIVDIQNQYENKTANKLSFDNVDFNNVYKETVPRIR